MSTAIKRSVLLRVVILATLILLWPAVVSACTCRNSTPVEKNIGRYAQRAVFTAQVIQSIGEVYDVNGERSSDKVIAVVHHRYWGFPAYWPGLVILDGSGLCGMGLLEGEEYFVSASQTSRLGVFDVTGCSRTQPLKTAPVDLRTLDGSLCSGPGGTLIGHVYSATDEGERSPVRNVRLTFRDFYGNSYATRSDDEGIYALPHVPPGHYVLESRIAPDRYASGDGEVTSGVCKESPLELRPYSVTGRLIPGIWHEANVELLPIEGRTALKPILGALAGDGRFYFDAVPAGDYFMVARFNLVGRDSQWTQLYYPGARTREKAVRLRFPDPTRRESFDFDPDAIPLTPIPVFVESPDPAHAIDVVLVLKDSSGHVVNQYGVSTGIPVRTTAIRGETYEISVLDSETYQTRSKEIRVTAKPGMKLTRIALTHGR